jgi:hypothetical protein
VTGSFDQRFIIFYTRVDPITSYTDLQLGSTESAAPPLVLASDTDAAVLGDAFTTDSSQVLYATSVDAFSVGVLAARPVAGGPVLLVGRAVSRVLAAGTTRIVYADDTTPAPKQPSRASLYSMDVASAAPPIAIAAGADAQFYLASGRTAVVYAVSSGSALDGIYFAPLH